jgi:hypothetical protein
MDQETLKDLEKRAISDAEDYFDALAKARPELTKPVVAKLAIVAAIEFQTAVLRRTIEEKLGGIEDILGRE